MRYRAIAVFRDIMIENFFKASSYQSKNMPSAPVPRDENSN